ncbi:MAG: transcription-repair coupling factor, partial [Alphaproteobacteria bacterium]|nr:transcription-repair coupling factor [Alphaproteobacteria bacterium]
TLPAFDCIPYDRVSPSQNVLSARVEALLALHRLKSARKKVCLVLCVESFLQRVPPTSILAHHDLTLAMGDRISRDSLLGFFRDMGFRRSETVYEVGDYAVRGSIVDCFPPSLSSPVRLDFFGDDIESIRLFDALSQQSTQEVVDVALTPVSELLLNDTTIEAFRTEFRRNGGSMDAPLYQAISNGRSYGGMEHFTPLFYPHMATIIDCVEAPTFVWGFGVKEKLCDTFGRIHLYYKERCQSSIGERPYSPLRPEKLYLSENESEEMFETGVHLQAVVKESLIPFVRPLLRFDNAKIMGLHALVEKVKEASVQKVVVIACKTDGALARAKALFQEFDLSLRTLVHFSEIGSSFGLVGLIYPALEAVETDNFILLPDTFFFGGRKKTKKSKQESIDHFLSELNAYAPGDFLVHTNHGVAKYLGLETVSVDRIKHDCLVLEYAESNKLFLPVENMEVLTTFAKEGAIVNVDTLGTAAWQHKKAKTKVKLLEVAAYLLKIAAERQLKTGVICDTKPDAYEIFCKGFPYIETDDQAQAIADVEEDLISGKPMDRLVCGDVGFGKTEVALRAAFIAVSSGQQVVIVVPTTLLARQHFAHFQARFKDTPYNVEMICRLVKARKASEIRQGLQEGNVHIVIATHAVFSDKLQFANLGLLIIDEEHHFGVKQKERLKTFRADIHVLTLTATPIPRTLQMSLTGIRDMSLITTPPVDRLPVRTFMLEQDFTLLRDVMMREFNRGGQIFFVSPRLEDLPRLKEKITSIAPELRIAVAHGQMSPSDLEDVIQDFYDHRFDVLLSTNIIESGIDIANANTLIVHKAHLFGLAQLYQIRGRIGRSKKQGYAYLTVPVDTDLTEAAEKRLKVLQSLDHLGAGFSLASHDMDIRGSGNLVGEQQSGHIREVGVELYQHMLQEAILSLRTEDVKHELTTGDFTPTLNLGIPVLIPETYVGDLSLRLGLYKRLSSLKDKESVEAFAAELIDRFGPLPSEVTNLINIIELKQLCYAAGIEKIDAGAKGLVIQFYKNTFARPEKLMAYMQKNPKFLKIRPDQKLVLTTDFENLSRRLTITTKLCQALVMLAG